MPRKKAHSPKPFTLRRPIHAVFLVGFMGAGKSSVGRALAQRLNWDFEDLDDRIEHDQGQTVAQIFRTSGESEFRRAEQAALKNILVESRSSPERIIALGGGALVHPGNAAALKTAGVPVVFLDAPVKELWNRCQRQSCEAGPERPLLGDETKFRTLFRKRRPLFLKASLRVETDGQAIAAVAQEIADALGLKRRIQEGNLSEEAN